MTDLVGRTLGPYQITAELGHGGMANVYRAVQPSIGREVAIKVLPTNFLQDRTFLERFTREVQIIAKLKHPRILTVHDFGEQDGLPYIVMTYMEGGTLSDCIRRASTTMPLDEVARLVGQIAEGLDFAHRKGIIHRDFKPSNVLLDEQGNVYLSDFGIAKVTEATAQLTGSGIIGTPAYMAPEMSKPGGVSPLIDVYALGVTLYEMLTGDQPYHADTPLGVLMAHALEPLPDARALRPDLPEAVQRVIEQAMAKDPLDRYQSAGELLADLRAAIESPVGAQQTVPLQPTPPPATPPAMPEEEAATFQTPPLPTEEAATLPTPPPEFLTERMPEAEPQADVIPAAVVPPPPVAAVPTTQKMSQTPPRPVQVQGAPRRRGMPAWVWIVGGIVLIGAVGSLLLVLRGALGQAGQGGPIATAVEQSYTTLQSMTSDSAADQDPTFSPDGNLLAFASNRGGNFDIYTMVLQGPQQGEISRNTADPADDLYPTFSPDGNLLAFASNRGGNFDIYTLVLNGPAAGEITRNTSDPADDLYPTFSQDGNLLAFASNRGGNFDIYTLILNGPGAGEVTRNTSDPAADLYPAFSRDGNLLAFASNRGGSFDIYTLILNGPGAGNTTRNTSDPADDLCPAFAPDGSLLAFASNRQGNFEIYLLRLGGEHAGEVTRATTNTVADFFPTFSLDGNLLAFASGDLRYGDPSAILFRSAAIDTLRRTAAP